MTTLSETLFLPKKQQEDEQLATNEDWLAGESVCMIGGSRKCWFYLILFTKSIHRFRFPISKVPRKTPTDEILDDEKYHFHNNILSGLKTF